MSRKVWLFFLLIFLCAPHLQADPLSPEKVPEPLRPWIDWVLQDYPDRNCPFIYNSYPEKHCSWPAQTHLDFTQKAGHFTASWKVYRESWISLPGDGKHWPLNVTANNKTALVMDKNGLPSIKLAEGLYQIKGEFAWDSIPDNLKIPDDTGLIDLSINGATIANPAFRDGQLWLKDSEIGQRKPENIQNSLDLQVFRKIIDEVPLQVLTHLDLEVSGEQREVKLAFPLLPNFMPLQLQSALPARLEPDGQLLVQVRPGRWQIEVLSRTVNELKTVPFNVIPQSQNPASETSWPQSEIWVFDAQPQLRVVEIESIPTIDPSQTNLPDPWKSLPAYKINQGQALIFKVIRRGDPEPEPNQLNLTRKLWLDFDGKGYTINDKISGTMTSGWRLNALPRTKLGKVTLDGNSQLITEQANTGKQGVEVRKGRLVIDADSRNSGAVDELSVAGWEQSFHTVSAELNLPPGWRLLAATGVDNVPDSWISRWTLLDIFLVLIAALATGKLWNVYWGLFAGVTLALIWHEPESPHFVWLNILAATALIKVLPQGKLMLFMTWYRNAFWLALVILVLPFMVSQVRIGLYPQLEKPWQAINLLAYPAAPQAMATMNSEQVMPEGKGMGLVEPNNESAEDLMSADVSKLTNRPIRDKYTASRAITDSLYSDKSVNFERIDPNAKVQTGPGLPQWQWHKVLLSWNGSVDAEQQLRLWYLSPKLTMLLNFVRVILISVLSLLMFGIAEKFRFKLKGGLPMLLGLALIPMLSMPSQNIYADIPDQVMLDNLRNKLLETPDCLPSCAQIPQMNMVITGKELAITLQIQAQQSVAIPLPADYEQWFPNQVLVDGASADGLFRNNNGLWINLSAGEHAVIMRGVTPFLNKFTLPLPLKPNRVTFEKSGWQVIGTQENDQVDNLVQFIKIQNAGETTKTLLDPGTLPPFVRIERTLQLGLDWRVLTQVFKIAPANSAVVLAVPLLPGESVSTEGIRVKDGKVEVNIPANQTVMSWSSKLDKSETIDLIAAQTEQWVEVWKADVSPIWHIESEGIAMIHLNNESQWLPEWHPWPGEKITLHVTRPKAVDGQTLTIDSSTLTLKPGQRSQDAELKFSVRSSQGLQHTLTLPEKAVLQSVMINGQTRPIRQEDRKLTLPVNPGKQDIVINWQAATPIASTMSTPAVDLGIASVNANINIELGQDRWVLFTFGPKFGPAVLFWGVLIVIVLVSIGLGKISLTPLKNWQWFLLLVGLSQIPIEMAGIVIAWLMLLGWRAGETSQFRFFNTLQIMLGMLTLLALGQLFYAVAQGLLSSPDMQIAGNQSSAYSLHWYQDRSSATLPTATVISVPLLVYRGLMLAWSLWLAVSLLNWLKWGWGCFSSGGLWRKKIGAQMG